MDHTDIPKPKNIIFRPCPICKHNMEVELIEIRKQLIEGEIDLNAVTKEWRHVCGKCFHETTKYIKTCHYCKIPDDIDKLVHNQFEREKEKAYYHAECERKSKVPYIIIAISVVLILTGALFGINIMMRSVKEDNQAIALIKEAEKIARNPFPADYNQKELYKQKRIDAIEQCKKAIKINPYYSKSYIVLGQLYLAERNKQEAANTLNQGLKTAKHNNEMELVKQIDKKLDKLKEEGITPQY